MTNRTPKTASDALRMAKSWEKAVHLIEDGYKFINCLTIPVAGHAGSGLQAGRRARRALLLD